MKSLTNRRVLVLSAAALTATLLHPGTASAAHLQGHRTTSTTTVSSTGTVFDTSCVSTITSLGGLPWRPGSCTTPAYTNHLVPTSPALNTAETAKVRSLSQALLNIDSYSEPVYYAAATTTPRSISCVKWGCVGGTTAPLTGSEVVAGGSDGQLIVVDEAGRRSYEFWQVAKDADGTVKVNADGSVTVGSMSVVDLDGRGNKTAAGGNLNITGSGVSRLFGVIRAGEVRAAATSPATAIKHGLQVSLPTAMNCTGSFREPATKTDGRATSTDCVQEGARVQLDPTYDCTLVAAKLPRAVCYAMQKYGAYVMDNNGSQVMAFYGQHRRSWSTGATDYAAAGITGDYQNLQLPMSRMRVLARWNGA